MGRDGRTWLSSYGCEQARDELERLLPSHRSGVDALPRAVSTSRPGPTSGGGSTAFVSSRSSC